MLFIQTTLGETWFLGIDKSWVVLVTRAECRGVFHLKYAVRKKNVHPGGEDSRGTKFFFRFVKETISRACLFRHSTFFPYLSHAMALPIQRSIPILVREVIHYWNSTRLSFSLSSSSKLGNSANCHRLQWKNDSFIFKIGITPVTIVTHADKLRSEEESKEALYQAEWATGSVRINTFLLANYTEIDSERNPEKERTILNILDCAVFLAETAVLEMKRNQKTREDEIVQAHGRTSVSAQNAVKDFYFLSLVELYTNVITSVSSPN